MEIKASLFHSTIVPALLYGAECWSTTKADEEKFAVTQRSMERRICKISLRDHISNTELRRRSGSVDIVQELYKRKRVWAGHVARLRDNRWTSRLTDWIPLDRKRPLGRPKTRWADPMVKMFGQQWKRRAQDRNEWIKVDLRGWRNTRGQVGYR